MIYNYLKSSWRNLMKNKIFSLINILGLALGLTACVLILQYVSFHLSYDRFNDHVTDIYRVVNDRYQNGKRIQHGTITYSAIGKAMQDDFPEVSDHCRVEPFGKSIISNQLKKIPDQEVLAVDHSFTTMFSYPLIAGDVQTALEKPYYAILTENSARKIFDIKKDDMNSLLGSTFTIGKDSTPYKVTAICKDVPNNSHLKFDILVSYTTMLSGPYPYVKADYDFTDSDFWHYLLLKHGTDLKKLEAKFESFSEKHFQGNKVSGSVEKFYLQPLSKAHLYSDFEYEIGETASATVVWSLLFIAGLIMVIAWVNYINLSTAKSMERAKEVGMRKVAGATKQQLILQFLSESIIINAISVLIAIVLVIFLQKSFNSLVRQPLSLSYLLGNSFQGYAVLIPLVVFILSGMMVSGLYPSLGLASFKPILVLKGKFTRSGHGIFLRKVLVVGQFAITIALIIGAFTIEQQIKFMNAHQLGMNIDQMLIVSSPSLSSFDSTFIIRENSFKEEIKKITNVKGAATSDRLAGDEMSRVFNVHRSDDLTGNKLSMRNMGADADFIPVYQIKVLAGRKFEQTDYHADYNKLHNVVINEHAVKLLGYGSNEEAIGKSITMFNKKWDIIGVINNYHQKSLRYALEPLVLQPFYSTYNPISIKINSQNLSSTLEQIKKLYADFFPGNAFNYFFLDDRFNRQYANDKLFGKTFTVFGGFAILIACLGLFGLSLLSTLQRTKEIGMRKVLGASVSNILFLISKDFIKLIFIAFVIGSPIAWYSMHTWLQTFAFRIHISTWIFIGAGVLATLIAMSTICIQAFKAAFMNPVKSIRTE